VLNTANDVSVTVQWEGLNDKFGICCGRHAGFAADRTITVAPIRAWYDIANAEHTNVEESLQT